MKIETVRYECKCGFKTGKYTEALTHVVKTNHEITIK